MHYPFVGTRGNGEIGCVMAEATYLSTSIHDVAKKKKQTNKLMPQKKEVGSAKRHPLCEFFFFHAKRKMVYRRTFV